jgi:hypothetical protein
MRFKDNPILLRALTPLSVDQKAQAPTNANGTLAAEKQNYDNWKEGGASRAQ